VTASVVSVNVGLPVDEAWAGRLRRTAIRKHPVSGPVQVRELGLDGDEVADKRDHGGPYQAVYAFAREDLDEWAREVGRPVADGMFGENLTTRGIDVNEALVGEQWAIGTAVFAVSHVRIPCSVFQNWLDVRGYDARHWVKRFTRRARPGPYLRVVRPGTVRAGDEIAVVHRPRHDVTVSTLFRALTTERALLPRLLDVEEPLAPYARDVLSTYLAAART